MKERNITYHEIRKGDRIREEKRASNPRHDDLVISAEYTAAEGDELDKFVQSHP